MIPLNQYIISILLHILPTLYFFTTCNNLHSKHNTAASVTRNNLTVSVKQEQNQTPRHQNLSGLLTVNVFLQYSDTYVIERGSSCPAFTTFHSRIHLGPETNIRPHNHQIMAHHTGLWGHGTLMLANAILFSYANLITHLWFLVDITWLSASSCVKCFVFLCCGESKRL